MKIGIYSPYLDTLGGGERYILTLAEILSKENQVDVFWDQENILNKSEKYFGLNLDGILAVNNVFNKGNFFERIFATQKYDLLIMLSDGSIPSSLARANIVHFQVPFKFNGVTVGNKIKLAKISKIVCNSQFTKKFIDQTFGVKSKVIYPPVNTQDFKPLKKENIILSVGRFDSSLHAKKQEILIDCFTSLSHNLSGWKLVLAGGSKNDKDTKDIKEKSKGYPIELMTDVSFSSLITLYGKARIYWHAAGFLEDEEKDPQKCEHFGISIVEAMSSGCVPVVVGKGGVKEIIDDGKNGFFWQTKKDLEKITIKLVNSEDLLVSCSKAAIKRSKNFSKSRFEKDFKSLLHSIL